MFSPHIEPPRSVDPVRSARVDQVRQTEPTVKSQLQDLSEYPDRAKKRSSEDPEEAEDAVYEPSEEAFRIVADRATTTVGRLMHSEVVTITPERTVSQLAELLEEHKISGVPVVEAGTDKLLGVVSQSDIAHHMAENSPAQKATPNFYQSLWIDIAKDDLPPTVMDTPVEAIMTPFVYYATEDSTLDEVTDLVLENDIHRVVVTRDGKLVGMVSATDLLRAYRAQSRQS